MARLADSLRKITVEQMAESESEWVPASKRAKDEGVTVATIYNRIRKHQIDAVNFEGRIFVRSRIA